MTKDVLYPGLDEHRAIEFLTATGDGTAIDGWHWLMETSTTSFYIKSMNRALQGAKVTLHGPDERHPGEDHYRFHVIRTPEMEVDPRSADRSARAGGRWLTDTSELPRYFTGRRIAEKVDHVVRSAPDTTSSLSVHRRRGLRGLPIAHTSIILLVVLTASWFTDVVGIYSVFGAFVAGAVMPRGPLLEPIRERFEPLVGYLLLPAFFIYSGLNTQLTLVLDPSTLVMAGIVLVVSFAAKFGAIGLAARWQGMSWYEAGSIGALANARGLMELILLNIGLEAGLISGKLYTILAVMTIIKTFVATPLQRLFEHRLNKSGSKFGPARGGALRRSVAGTGIGEAPAVWRR